MKRSEQDMILAINDLAAAINRLAAATEKGYQRPVPDHWLSQIGGGSYPVGQTR